MEALDGNAMAGALFEYFGTDMTTAPGSCAHCATAAQIAELRVYSRAPGTVARCPSCGHVVIVLARIHSSLRIELSGFRLLEPAVEDPPSTHPHPSP